jgi:hypothetical protein
MAASIRIDAFPPRDTHSRMFCGPFRNLCRRAHHTLKNRSTALAVKMLDTAGRRIADCANNKNEVNNSHRITYWRA